MYFSCEVRTSSTYTKRKAIAVTGRGGLNGMWILLRTDILEEPSAPIIRVTRISELGMLAITTGYFFAACVGCWDVTQCEMLRIPHCLHNRLIDGAKVGSFTPQKHYISASGTHFC
jgi:hypothetical protein